MKVPPSESLERLIEEILDGSDPDLNDREIARLNEQPADEVAPLLIEKFKTLPNLYGQSRAFDGLMKLAGFDQVGFLTAMLDEIRDPVWRAIFCEKLGAFKDARAVATLCQVLQTDKDGDSRFVAAESLGEIGDASALKVLAEASKRDAGVDYEGRPVSVAAERALRRVQARMGLKSA